ncbi:Hca operon transcriptional activator HcaR [Bradyrhizobium ivorense]|uniref:Hca operon transcriptional activator HcaR n=2 Tax=Bradyrhizobium ivorense TaxID=2511166 RepID=A0A508TGF6_9BRAD|nr:Hca operon transcriptional activator HcaR [Bradyrhizobium ivorense]
MLFGMAMDLKRLRYFVAVAEEGHVTRAAEKVGMQQPALSLQIKALERELDVQLFRRIPRGVELTSAGEALLADAKALLAHRDRAVETTRRAARGAQGRLWVGMTPTAPFHPLVPRAIRAYRQSFPLVSLALEEALSNELIERFAKDQMDVAFFVRSSSVHVETLVVSTLLEEPMIAALPSLHPMAQNRRSPTVHLRDLASDPFILIGPPGTSIHDETVAACRAAGFNTRVGQQAPRITSTLGLVAGGMGVALVPGFMQNMRMDGVVYRRLKGPQPKVFLGLASRRGDPSPVVRQFLSLVKRVAKKYSGHRDFTAG